MMPAGSSVGSSALASATHLSTDLVDPWDAAPIVVTYRGYNVSDSCAQDHIRIDDTQGEQSSMTIDLRNPRLRPVIGDAIEVKFYEHIIFSGTIDKVVTDINATLNLTTYKCTAVDWTQVLVRRKIDRTYTDGYLSTFIQSVIDEELSGEGFSLGTLDRNIQLDAIKASKTTVLDAFREAASFSGLTLHVSYDKVLSFISISNPSTPYALISGVLESAQVTNDRDNYRNVQTVIIKGSPTDSSETALEVTATKELSDRIADMAAREGGSGRYEDIQTIDHPTSNSWVALTKMARAYADILLTLGGYTRETLTLKTRGYGYRSGQLANVTIASLGITGSWIIQRVELNEEFGRRLVHTIELVRTSLQYRAYSSWDRIFKRGQVVVSLPWTDLATVTVEYTTPGTYYWVVPSGVTAVAIVTEGAGGGGGGAGSYAMGPRTFGYGGKGGEGGRTLTNLDVTPGSTLTVIVGAGGSAGESFIWTYAIPDPDRAATAGAVGGASSVEINGAAVSVAYGGGGGGGATITLSGIDGRSGAKGYAGSGLHGIVAVGGGRLGGENGTPALFGFTQPQAGANGYVSIEY